MYPVSAAYKTAIKKDVRDMKITGTITLKDSSVINVADEDIAQGSLYFTEQCVSGEDLEIGNVYASELGLTLTSPPENPYSLDGARIIINFGINVEPDTEEDPIWEYVPLGYFYVTEIERKQTTVNLKALDGLILFDVDLSGVLTTGTPYALVSSCCTKAGVTLATSSGDFADFANGLSPFTVPDESKIETCRDLIMWICQLTGTFARMNREGQLEVIPVTAGSSVKTISKPERFTSDVSDFYVKITKVTMKIGEEEYSQGTAGMTLALEENPLMADKSEAEINAALAEILAQVTEAEYTPYNLTCAGDPALQAGDWVKLTGVSNINGPEFEYSRNSPAIHPETGAEVGADTPIFMPFAGDKQGLLMEEGTENLISNPKFEEDGLSGWGVGSYLDVSVEDSDCPIASKHAAVTLINSPSKHWFYVSPIDIVPSGTYTVSLWAKIPEGLPVIMNLHDETHSSASYKTVTGNGTWQKYTHVRTFSEDTTKAGVYLYHAGDVDTTFYVTAVQLEAKPYPTTFTVGTRANPTSLLTLPEALPDEFGIGISAKMLHAHGIKSRTFWQAGDYHRLFYDMADSKIKMQYGGAIAETSPVSWSADDIIGVYGGKKDGKLFVQAKVAGELGEKTAVEVGGRNLLLLSDVEVTNAIYGIARYDFSESPIEGETYTLTLKGTLGEDRESFRAYNSGGAIFLCRLIPNEDGTIFSKTFTWRVTSGERTASNTYLQMYQFLNTGTSESTIEWIKLERGNEATPWTPAPEDGDTNDLYIGSLPDESENVNAVIADFTIHDSGDIDPEGYLSRVPGGGE